MGKRGRPRSSPPSEELLTRIEHLLEVLFQGNQVRLAGAMGICSSLVSKIITRAQRPSEAFIESLANLPLVNRDWLLYGQGQALLPATAGTLPISLLPLPGSPASHPGLLSGRRHPIAPPLEAPDRYWLELPPDSDFIFPPHQNMQPGDLLLTQTAPEYVQRRDAVVGRLCVVNVSLQGTGVCCLARVFSEAGELWAELNSRHAAALAAVQVSTPLERMRRRYRRQVSEPKGAKNTGETAAVSRQAVLPPGVVRLSGMDAIVGVCLMLERPNLMAAWTTETATIATKVSLVQKNKDFDKIPVKREEKTRVKN